MAYSFPNSMQGASAFGEQAVVEDNNEAQGGPDLQEIQTDVREV